MKWLFLMGALASFAGAIIQLLVVGDWYGAMGWFIVGGYQLADFAFRHEMPS
jgi:hypothetical protein